MLIILYAIVLVGAISIVAVPLLFSLFPHIVYKGYFNKVLGYVPNDEEVGLLSYFNKTVTEIFKGDYGKAKEYLTYPVDGGLESNRDVASIADNLLVGIIGLHTYVSEKSDTNAGRIEAVYDAVSQLENGVIVRLAGIDTAKSSISEGINAAENEEQFKRVCGWFRLFREFGLESTEYEARWIALCFWKTPWNDFDKFKRLCKKELDWVLSVDLTANGYVNVIGNHRYQVLMVDGDQIRMAAAGHTKITNIIVPGLKRGRYYYPPIYVSSATLRRRKGELYSYINERIRGRLWQEIKVRWNKVFTPQDERLFKLINYGNSEGCEDGS